MSATLPSSVVPASRAAGVRPRPVLLLARSLDVGGAERQLVLLAVELRRRGREVLVATFYAGGALEAELHAAGVRLETLGKTSRWDVTGFARRYVALVRRVRPSAVYAFLVVPNLLASVARPLYPKGTRVIWGVRAAALDWGAYDRVTRLTFSLSRRAAPLADEIIVNSRAGASYHAGLGYPASRLRVVPNGIDTGRFRRDVVGALAVRRELGIPDDAPLVGLVARIDVGKGHETFLDAAALVRARVPAARFLIVGGGDAVLTRELQARAAALGVADAVVWTGARTDLPACYSALDVHVSASHFEGFSNVIAESMASEAPGVVTDVGDSAWMVGDTGRVVPAGDPVAMADAVCALLTASAADRRAIGAAARARVQAHFSIEHMVDATLAVLEGA